MLEQLAAVIAATQLPKCGVWGQHTVYPGLSALFLVPKTRLF
jgi:hypothetical protein